MEDNQAVLFEQKNSRPARNGNVRHEHRGMDMSHREPDSAGWYQYALGEKVRQLEKEESLREKLQAENETLKNKLHEQEKTLIQKDNEITALHDESESGKGLGGVLKSALADKESLNQILGAIPMILEKMRPGAPGIAGNPGDPYTPLFAEFVRTHDDDYMKKFWPVLNFVVLKPGLLDTLFAETEKTKAQADDAATVE